MNFQKWWTHTGYNQRKLVIDSNWHLFLLLLFTQYKAQRAIQGRGLLNGDVIKAYTEGTCVAYHEDI